MTAKEFRDEVRRITDDIDEAHCEPGCPEKNPYLAQIERELNAAIRDYDTARDLEKLSSRATVGAPPGDEVVEVRQGGKTCTWVNPVFCGAPGVAEYDTQDNDHGFQRGGIVRCAKHDQDHRRTFENGLPGTCVARREIAL